MRMPCLHVTSFKSVVSNLVEIVSNLNRRRLIKVHIDIELCSVQAKVLLIVEWVERHLMYGEVMAKTGTAFSSEIGDKTKNICAKC